MQKVFKYKIEKIMELPQNTNILCVNGQNGKAHMWAEVDPEEKQLEERYFEFIATGMNIPANGKYIGTIFYYGGDEVYHCYELKRRK